jgi:hypothetical protein
VVRGRVISETDGGAIYNCLAGMLRAGYIVPEGNSRFAIEGVKDRHVEAVLIEVIEADREANYRG